MKKIYTAGVYLLLTGLTAWSQAHHPPTVTNQVPIPTSTPYQIVAADGDESVWQSVIYSTNAAGKVLRRVHKYEEVAAGLNHIKNGQWVKSSELIDILQDGSAAATNGQHQAYFPPDLYEGEINLTTPEGFQLKSRPIALSYDDGTNFVIIAELTNSIGQLIEDNQAIYTNAFVGVQADVLYTYKKGSFEQDIIIRKQLPTPESLGLNPDATKLQVLTEFFDPPQPIINTNLLPITGSDPVLDHALDFGVMKMAPGRAFMLGTNTSDSAWVGKQWLNLEGRTILVEEVPVNALANDLSSLPLSSRIESAKPSYQLARKLKLPTQIVAKANSRKASIRFARMEKALPGLVLDYNAVIANSSDFTFRGDTTYYINGGFWLSGVTTIEGGAVLKCATTNGNNPLINSVGSIKCATTPYRPAIFTTMDDNSVGEIIPGSTGNPVMLTQQSTIGISFSQNYYYMSNSGAFFIHDCQFRYLNVGVVGSDFGTTPHSTNEIRDCQFYSVYNPIAINGNVNYPMQMNVRNVLADTMVYFSLTYNDQILNCENITIHKAWNAFVCNDNSAPVTVVNGLFIAVTNTFANCIVSASYCATNASDAGIFQTAGAGAHYLPAGSPYRGAGTTAINSALLNSLRQKTTYAPTVLSSTNLATATTLIPQNVTDTNANPDLGYHYPVVDYVVSGLSVSNTTLTITNGAVIASYGSYGVQMVNGGNLVSIGTPLTPNWFVRSASVQEQPYQVTNSIMADASGTATGVFRFTKFTCPAVSGYDLYHAVGSVYASLDVRNCEFLGGANDFSGATNTSRVSLVNNLFARSSLFASNTTVQASLFLTNNTVWGTSATLVQPSGGVWSAFNNNFDSSVVIGSLTNGYNAYNNAAGRLTPTNAFDKIATNTIAYQTGPLGGFYLAPTSPLLNAGNTNASLLGLYQFTTQTNQAKEQNSIVDIGYHYVATDTNGNPIASGGDGIPDYLADPNGNTNWLSAPAITSQPASQWAVQGDDVFFRVTATGYPLPTYQWYKSGSVIANGTNATLELDNVTTNAIGSYQVVVSNPLGTVVSLSASLTAVSMPSTYVVLNGSISNYVFQSDTTYYINSTVQAYGTTTIEGGTVIKYGNHPASQLVLNGLLISKTAPYRPALLTSKDDEIAGAHISTATGTPANNYNARYLVDAGSQTNVYKYLHIKYAGIGISSANSVNVWDSQFINGGTAVSSTNDIALHNVLVVNQTNCLSTTGNITAEFLTADKCQVFCPQLYLAANVINSILTGLPNDTGINLVSSVSLANGSAVYTTVGGGQHYLANGTFRALGTTNVSLAALNDIATKTTVSPMMKPPGLLNQSICLYPIAALDKGNRPDLGYHYDPVDYALGGVYLENAAITVNEGTTIAFFGTNGGYGSGLLLENNASFLCYGSADKPVRIAQYSSVQEQAGSGWLRTTSGEITHFSGTNSAIAANFVNWSVMAQDCPHFNMQDEMKSVSFTNCQFSGGQMVTWYPAINLKNCLLERVNADLEPGDDNTPEIINCLVKGGTFGFGPWNVLDAKVKNNLFDKAVIPNWLGAWGWDYDGGNNAYANGSDTLDPIYTNDIVITGAVEYVTGPLGEYYLPSYSPLLHKGSTTADALGLYDFTTQASEVIQSNSVVDVGFHYKARSAIGSTGSSGGCPPITNGCTETGPHYAFFEARNSTSTGFVHYFTVYYDCPGNVSLNSSHEFSLVDVWTNGVCSSAGGIETFSGSGWYWNPPPDFNYEPYRYIVPGRYLYPHYYDFCTCPPTNCMRFWLTNEVVIEGHDTCKQLINLDFSAPTIPPSLALRRPSKKTGMAATGLSRADYWNLITTNATSLELNGLLAADGAITSLSVSMSQLKTAETNGSRQAMYGTCLGSQAGSNILITVTGLSAGTNDIILYSSDAKFRLSSGTRSYGEMTCRDPNTAFVAPWTENRQFVCFSNVITKTGESLSIIVEKATSGKTLVSGMQIVSYSTNAVPLHIENQPASQTVDSGSTVSFQVYATGVDLHYQWYDSHGALNDSGIVSGSQADSLTLTYVRTNRSGIYYVVVSNPETNATSSLATLTVRPPSPIPPSIVQQPTNLNIGISGTALFAVTATGAAPLSYQWKYNGTNISAATNFTLILANVQTNNAGSYAVVVTNIAGSITSTTATLTVHMPLLPVITRIDTLQIPADNGSYALTFQTILTNSDAVDPNGYPFVFKVESVISGSLMINGSPYSGGNFIINTNDSVTWVPPSIMAAPGTAAFRLFIDDGVNRSTNSVNLEIKQHPKTYLMAWGQNGYYSPYTPTLGTGWLPTHEVKIPNWSSLTNSILFGREKPATLSNRDGQPSIYYQNFFNQYPYDYNTHFLTTDSLYSYWLGTPAKIAPELSSIKSIARFGDDSGSGHCAVTEEGKLWFWGEARSYCLGLPWVLQFTNGPQSPQNLKTYLNWNEGLFNYDQNIWAPWWMTLFSPVLVKDSTTGLAISDVADAKDHYILKKDGSLWSFGETAYMIGRKPVAANDLFDHYGMQIGMRFGRVEIGGNSSEGIDPGKEIKEIVSAGWMGNYCSTLALCKDGSLWGWGLMYDVQDTPFSTSVVQAELFFQLSGTATREEIFQNGWKPKHLINVESASTSPIDHIYQAWNHVIILRKDGSVSEVGYIPKQDPGLWTTANCFTGYYGSLNRDGHGDFSHLADYYRQVPVTVTNVPSDIKQICVAPSFGAILTDSGEVWVWGHWIDRVLQTPEKITSLHGISKIAAGGQYIIALDRLGRLWGVGLNNDGAFGFNDLKLEPVAYGTLGIVDSYPVDHGIIHSNAVRIPGIENVTDVQTVERDWMSQVYAQGTDVQGKPTGLTTMGTNQGVILNWNIFPAANSYIVYRSETEDDGYFAIGNAPVNSFKDTSPPLQNGKTYYYRIGAVINGVETSPSWDVAGTPYPAPTAVQNLTASWNCLTNGVRLQWSQPANVTNSPLLEYVVLANGIQLAEIAPETTNYYDQRADIPTNCTYVIQSRNSSGVASATNQLSTNTTFLECPPAPYVSTKLNKDNDWLSVQEVPASDFAPQGETASLIWASCTNGSWLFQPYEFDTYAGIPPNETYPGVAATETVTQFIATLAGEHDQQGLPRWIWLQITNIYTPILTNASSIQSIQDLIGDLATADLATNFLQAWIWSQFDNAEVNVLTNSSDIETNTAILLSRLSIIALNQYTNLPPAYTTYALQLLNQIRNTSGQADASEVNVKMNFLTLALNQMLTNGVSVYEDTNVLFSLTNNDSSGWFRMSTSNLYATNAIGVDLVQLKRMLIDDYFQGQYFTRGPNWGSKLTGFRIHYRTLLNAGGRSVKHSFKRDVPLISLKHKPAEKSYDGEATYPHWMMYSNAWSVPFGAVCWASVGAMVDGEESLVSPEIGPKGLSGTLPDLSLRAMAGQKQMYLDWKDDPMAYYYNLYYSVDALDVGNSASPGWQELGSNITTTRFWHTNLTQSTPYYYQLVAYDLDLGQSFFYASNTAVVGDQIAATNFWARASAYDGMVNVEWIVPKTNSTDKNIITQTNWQFFVERKLASENDAHYEILSDAGYELAFLDSTVVNGIAYNYRVTAFDTVFNRLVALATNTLGSTNITPNTTGGLTLLPPTPGNGFVDLSWSPIRANQFSIKHALNPGGPFDVVDAINVNDAYQNAKNTYRHIGVQNGVMHYYKISALTPTGFELNSDVLGAMPLSTLTPLPPNGFKAKLVPLGTSNIISLTWNSQSGVSKYQLFQRKQGSMISLYNGSGTFCRFNIPDAADVDTVYNFSLRALNAGGLASDFVEASVTNQAPDDPVDAGTSAVVLSVVGTRSLDFTGVTNITGPTNLTLSAEVNVPNVEHVDFYDDNQIVGSADNAPYLITWFHVPRGSHPLKAVAVLKSSTSGSGLAISSGPITVNITIAPELSAYQTSAMDLQIPAPALPISISRFYTSRSTETNGSMGVGWTAGWNASSVKLSHPLDEGWSGVTQNGFASSVFFYISDEAGHTVTVTLPDGQSIEYGSQLQCDAAADGLNNILHVEPLAPISFQPYMANAGMFSNSLTSLTITHATDENYYLGEDISVWNDSIDMESATLDHISYTSPTGTFYQFGQAGNDNLTWLLTKVTDRNGNTLNYLYDNLNRVKAITNSCGRQVTFGYTPTTYGTNICVTNMTAGAPVVVYVVSNNLLTEVRQLIARTNFATTDPYLYHTNRYVYGTTGADANRLTDVYDSRGVRVLHNAYTTNTTGDYAGDLAMQISPGRTNTFNVDPVTYDLTVTTSSSTATNTAKVLSDDSGAIAGATVPVSGKDASPTNAVQCSYDGQGNLVSQTDASGSVKTYAYDEQNRLVGQSDENGNSTAVELNEFGQPNVSTDANGKQTIYQYDNAGNPLSVRDPSGSSTSYVYLDAVTNSDGTIRLGGLLTKQGQSAPYVPFNIVTRNIYQTAGTIVGDLLQTAEEWQNNSGTLVGISVTNRYAYDVNGNRIMEIKLRTSAGGGIQYITNAYTYDAQNRVVMTVVSAGGASGVEVLLPQTNTVTYNLQGKQAKSTDAAGRITTNTYDFNGNLIETAYPDGTVSRTSYDGFGRQEYVQERSVPYGNHSLAPATRNYYDASGRVVKVEKYETIMLTKTNAIATTNETPGDFFGAPVEPQFKMLAGTPTGNGLATSRTFYDAVGRVQYSVDARGAVSEYRYDAGGRRTNVLVYPQGLAANVTPSSATLTVSPLSTSYTYDANGNQITVTDAARHTTTSVYDDANRVKEIKYPGASNGTLSRLTYYDGLGRKIQETDEAGVNTAYTYDFRGFLTSVTLAFGTTQAVTTVYNYDELGNMITQTDAAGHVTTFKYDALGRRVGRNLPGGQSEGYCYDRYTGNLLYQTNFNGVIITNLYDNASGRLLACGSKSGGYLTSYGYSATGLRTNMTDAGGATTYRYNGFSQLTNKVVALAGGPTLALNYGYSAVGSLTNLWSDSANGVTNSYQYDLLGRITNVLANGVTIIGYGFDAVGNLQSQRYGNGMTNLYQYDARNRLTNLVWRAGDWPLANFSYTVGVTGNRTDAAESFGGASQSYHWAYDYLYRLTGETLGSSGTVNYKFDAVGNRTNRNSSISGIGNQTPTFTANDWLTTDGYDSNGNTTTSGATNYQYDVMNHLTNVNSGQILIAYDGDGNRVSKKVNGVTTYYLVDDRNPSGYAQVLEEWTSTGTPALSMVYNYGLALVSQRQTASGTVSYFGLDGHGSTRFLMNTNGTITDTYWYDAYGLPQSGYESTPNRYRYCAQQWDSDLGMYYNRARYLNPNTGRFWSMDSVAGSQTEPLSLHKYLYASASPVNRIDPGGNDDFSLGSLATSMGIGAAIGATSSFYANVALGRAQTMSSIFMGAAWGAVLGPYAAAIPEFAVGLGAYGIYGSGSIAYQVFTDPNATVAQKTAATGLVVGSIWGVKVASDYYKAVGGNPPSAIEESPAPVIPKFPLPLRAPPGVRIRSMAQNSLKKGSIEQIPGIIESMLNGNPVPGIGGMKSGNTYWINEGHHRMTAALEIYTKTGDASHVNKLLNEGNFKTGQPMYDYQMTLEGNE